MAKRKKVKGWTGQAMRIIGSLLGNPSPRVRQKDTVGWILFVPANLDVDNYRKSWSLNSPVRVVD